MSVRHRKLNPDTVTHLSTNRARRRLTLLIEANALTTTPDHRVLFELSVTGNTRAYLSIMPHISRYYRRRHGLYDTVRVAELP